MPASVCNVCDDRHSHSSTTIKQLRMARLTVRRSLCVRRHRLSFLSLTTYHEQHLSVLCHDVVRNNDSRVDHRIFTVNACGATPLRDYGIASIVQYHLRSSNFISN